MAAPRKLSDDARKEIVRRWFAREMTQAELAYTFDCSEKTVYSIIARAKLERAEKVNANV